VITLTPAELSVIRADLTEKSHALRKRADSVRGITGTERAGMRVRAGTREDIAARLAFAVPGEPIQVVDVVA
jgi:hypothetical protein